MIQVFLLIYNLCNKTTTISKSYIMNRTSNYFTKTIMLYQNILLIDDDIDDIDILTEAINSIHDKKVCRAVNNRVRILEALQNSEEVPDLIFMDLNIPGVNHRELLEEIKKSPYTGEVPIVLYSSHTKEIMQQLAQPFEIAHYVTKPTSYQELIRLLKEIFSR